MSFNMKTEPIVELSSDEDDSTQNGISNEIKRPDRPGTPETHCSICLEELTNKCYSDSCWHMFCFECLKQWSTIQSSCPLCKKSFKVIHHTFNDQGLHESYQVPLQERELPSRITFHPVGRLSEVNRIFRMNLFLDIVRRSERMHILPVEDHNHNVDLHSSQFMRMNPPTRYDILSPRNRQNGQIIRARVYSENVWAEPLPDLSGRFRECSSVFYRENPAQTHRLHGFILRDIIAIRSLERSDMVHSITTDDVITSMIMRSVSNFDIREPYMIGLLRPYLGNYSAHFCHELYNYAHSPYDMIGYDRNVRYSTRQSHSSSLLQMSPSIFQVPIELPELVPIINMTEPHSQSETIVLDTDDEDIGANTRQFGSEVIVLTSSSEESDVEIIRHSYNPPIDSSSRDQPSTSTGIRDSLDRPNNRYNFRRRRFFSPTSNASPRYPVHMSRMAFPPEFRRGITLDSSSDDEESSTSSRSPSLLKLSDLVCSRRKRQIKKNKQKKRKKTDNESRPEGIGSRSRSYSESSSSSGDTDTRSNPTCMPLHNIVL